MAGEVAGGAGKGGVVGALMSEFGLKDKTKDEDEAGMLLQGIRGAGTGRTVQSQGAEGGAQTLV